MRKQLIRTSKTMDLFMVYDDTHCFYVISVGKIKVNKNGEIRSRNVLYSSKQLQDCLNYFDNEGTR